MSKPNPGLIKHRLSSCFYREYPTGSTSVLQIMLKDRVLSLSGKH